MSNELALLRALVALSHAHPTDSRLVVAMAGAPQREALTPGYGNNPDDHDAAPEARRLRALVDLAKDGDGEAFGELYDHYSAGIFRFIYYRVGTKQLAEDLTSETFVRGLRAIQRFTWQGKDFGAWLTTIARNLITDHFKSSRSRLEFPTEAVPETRATAASPESEVLSMISNEMLFEAVNGLPPEQRDCILMRFIQGLSIAQTAATLGRSEGAIKQLQLRAVRSLAKSMPADIR